MSQPISVNQIAISLQFSPPAYSHHNWTLLPSISHLSSETLIRASIVKLILSSLFLYLISKATTFMLRLYQTIRFVPIWPLICSTSKLQETLKYLQDHRLPSILLLKNLLKTWQSHLFANHQQYLLNLQVLPSITTKKLAKPSESLRLMV